MCGWVEVRKSLDKKPGIAFLWLETGQKIKCETICGRGLFWGPPIFREGNKSTRRYGLLAVAVMDAGTFLPTVKQNRRPKDKSRQSIYRGVTSRKRGVKKWIAQQRIPGNATADVRTQHIGIFVTETEAGSAWTAMMQGLAVPAPCPWQPWQPWQPDG